MMENLCTHDEELMSIYKSRMETRKITSPFFEKQCQKLGTVMYCIWKTQCWRSTKKGLICKTVGIQLLKHPCEVSHVSQVTKNQPKKKNLIEKCVTQLLRKLDPTFVNFWNSQTFRDLFRPFFAAPQNLLRSMSGWHWWPARMDEVPPGGGKPSLVVTQARTWHEPSQDSMEWNWWCFFLFTAAQMSKTELHGTPQPIKNLAVLGRSGNVHLKKKIVC